MYLYCIKAFDGVDRNKLWKILQEMGIPDHIICLLRSLYAGQKATVRNGHGTTDWFKIGKGVWQNCILSPCLFNLCAQYIMLNAELDKSQAGIKCARESVNLRYADDITLKAENEEELSRTIKCVLMKVKDESEKAGLKLNIQKTKMMASSAITSWQIDRGKMQNVTDFIFFGSKITVDSDCSHELKDACSLEEKLWWTCVCVCAKSLQSCWNLSMRQPHGLQPARLLCPWDAPGKNTGVGCHALLQRIFPMQGSNSHLLQFLNYRQIFYCWTTG